MVPEPGDVVIVRDGGRDTPYLIDGYDEEMQGTAGFPIRINSRLELEVDDCLHLIDGCGVVVAIVARADVPEWKRLFQPEE